MASHMPIPRTPVQVFDALGEDYRRAFETFLASTDQKKAAHDYLTTLVGRLPKRRVFIDVGAGEGGTTRRIAKHFECAIAVEPNPHLHTALRQACPDARVLSATIDHADIAVRADLVLCAHVLYYLPRSDWAAVTRRMLSWTAEGGELVLAMQNPRSDCLRMVHAFTSVSFDLASLGEEIERDAAELGAEITLDTVPATIHTEREVDAVAIAQFMFNLAPLRSLDDLPCHTELQAYVRSQFADLSGGFTFTCTQDFLRVRRHCCVDR
jgi:SAM-dependent methyltransferase